MFIVLFRSFLVGLELNLRRHAFAKNVSITLSYNFKIFKNEPKSGTTKLSENAWLVVVSSIAVFWDGCMTSQKTTAEETRFVGVCKKNESATAICT